MSDGRSRKSGSKYKRLREEREEKEKEGRIKSLLGLFFHINLNFTRTTRTEQMKNTKEIRYYANPYHFDHDIAFVAEFYSNF
ncbi:hypothetical protein QTP88_019658 [Uroleucon formosanum]